MRLWLDDVRPLPEEFDVRVKTAPHAIALIKTGLVTHISLDHDLGDASDEVGAGKDVANFIEEGAFHGTVSPMECKVHSANPVGVEAMEQALKNARRYWGQRN